MVNIHKEYPTPFVLEPTKLRRLIDLIDERLTDKPNSVVRSLFEVFMRGDRHEELAELQQVLELENSRKYQITRLIMTRSTAAAEGVRPEREVQVDFGCVKTDVPSGSRSTIIAVSVRGGTSGWANGTLSEVEEQIERNRPRYGRSLIALIGIAVVALFLLISQLVYSVPPPSYDLTASEMDRVEKMLAQRPTLTDEDLREIETMRLRNVIDYRKEARAFENQHANNALFVAVPVGVIVVCIVTLLGTCYPSVVFLWGDETERYATLVHRRRTIWGIIIGITVVGVASKFLFEHLSLLFSH